MDELLITDLLQDIEEKVNSVHNAVQQISTAGAALKTLEERMLSLETSYNTLRQKLQELEKKQAQLPDLIGRRLETQLKILKEEQEGTAASQNLAIAALREDTAQNNQHLAEIGAKLGNLNTTVTELEKKLANTQIAVKGLATNDTELQHRQQEITQQIAGVKQEIAPKLGDLSARVDMLHNSQANLERRNEKLSRGVNAADTGLQELSRQLTSFRRDTIDSLTRRLEDLEENIIITSHTLKGLTDNDTRINNSQQELAIEFDIHRERLDKLETALAAVERASSLDSLQLEQKIETAVAAALEPPRQQITQVFEIVKRHHQQLQGLTNNNR